MPVLGFHDHWAMSCSLNLASCRLRAESLARQLHNNLWIPRSQHGSPGGSGSVSPCFGLPASPLGVIDRPPIKIDKQFMMSSLDDEEPEMKPVPNGDARICSPQMSPPYSPLEKMGLLPKNSRGLFEKCKEENHVWRPDSPPESFASETEVQSDSPALTIETESEVQSDSPALTIETEEPSSTTSNSVETVSELASPTYDYREDENPLADQLRTRLKLIQSNQFDENCMNSPSEEVTEEKEDTSISSTLSSASTNKDLLSPPEPCPRLVRSTSLKTGKTPPGTPSRKKFVRFADVLGLDLEAIRHFAKDDDAPIVPQSAFADLKVPTSQSTPQFPWSANTPGLSQAGYRFVPQFEAPGTNPHFLDKVRQQKVCLEDAVVNDMRVTGVVRVLNLGFEKLVQVRYTTTEWAVHTDLDADYVPKSCDGFSDKFSFHLHIPHMVNGQKLVFALRYVTNGQEFWDNNGGENYVLKCQAKSPDQDSTGANGRRWQHHFM